MKKTGLFIAALALASLAGCGQGGSSYTVPTTSFEKVKTAFSGVEKSFKNVSSRQKSVTRNNLLKFDSSTLDSLFALYTNEDDKGDVIEDLSYTQPPMIQFQCLKYAFDKIGGGYSFDTKYYDAVTGKVYIDTETGLEAEHVETYEFNFNFVLSLDIKIDSNDLITADITFEITFSKGEESYDCNWYVGMTLDYDMNNESPTYTLTMLTNNDERNVPYFDRCTYEYDYVEVKENKINEWRKFDLEAPVVLVKDAAHPTFDSYLTGDMEYKVGSFAWYKNKSFYKINDLHRDADKQLRAANLMYEFGLNATDIDGKPFYDKQGSKNSVIQNMYQEFSNILKKDIIYDLITHEEDEGGHQEEEKNDPAYLEAINLMTGEAIDSKDECFLSHKDAKFGHLISSGSYNKDAPAIPHFNVLNEKKEYLREPFSDEIDCKVVLGENKVSVNKETKVVDFMDEHHMTSITVELSLMVEGQAIDSATILINGNPFCKAVKNWPYDTLKSLGLDTYVIPFTSSSYYSAVSQVDYSVKDLSCTIEVTGLNYDDVNNYNNAIKNAKYYEVDKTPKYIFADTNRNIVFDFWFESESDSITIHVNKSNSYSCTYTQAEKEIFSELGQNVLIPEGAIFSREENQPNCFNFYGLSKQTYDQFVQRLSDNNWNKVEVVSNVTCYYDYNGTRYCIFYDEYMTNYPIRVQYFTDEIPTKKFDRADLEFETLPSVPMENDENNNFYTVFSVPANESFCIIGYYGGEKVRLGYSDLTIDETTSTYFAEGKKNYILVLQEMVIDVRVIASVTGNTIVCTPHDEGGGGGGGEVVPQDHTYSLIGEFNQWSADKGGIALTYSDITGYSSIENYSFSQGKGFVIVEDNSWNVYYGYSHLSGNYSEYIIEGDTNGIVPIKDFTATIKFYGGTIYLENIVPSGDDEGGDIPEGTTIIALAGSFNSWNEKDETYAFAFEEGTYSIKVNLAAKSEFKIVFNKSWNGCYGYDNISGFASYDTLFGRESKNANIICLVDVKISISATLVNDDLVFTVQAQEA